MKENDLNKFQYYVANTPENGEKFNLTSDLWKSLLSQREQSSITIKELEHFLNPESLQASGTGNLQKRHALHINIISEYIGSLMRKKDLIDFPCSWIGCPPKIEILESSTNLAFAWNLLRFLTYKEKVKLENVNAIEVGPGYGCGAYLWIKIGMINSYTLIDLKENLINSYYFLGSNFPDWSLNLVDENTPLNLNQRTINFITAERVSHLEKTPLFDLVLNSDSFGEMPKVVAQEYIKLLETVMKDKAIFISMNGHRRGSIELSGVQKVSEYGYDQFNMEYFSYKPYFSSPYDDFGHYVILSKKNKNNDKYLYIDILSNLFALGVNTDLDEVLQRFNSNNLNDEDHLFFDDINKLLRDERHSTCSSQLTSVFEYITLMRKALKNNRLNPKPYRELAKRLSSPQAKYYLILMIYTKGKINEVDWKLLNSSPAMRFLATDIRECDGRNLIRKKVHKVIRIDQLRKKFYPYKAYKASMIIRLKEMIAREGISVS